MKIFKNYRKRIEVRLNELLTEKQLLIDERNDVNQFRSTKEYCLMSVKITDKEKIINELIELLK